MKKNIGSLSSDDDLDDRRWSGIDSSNEEDESKSIDSQLRLSAITTPREAAMITQRAYGADAKLEIVSRARLSLEAGHIDDCLFWHAVLARLAGVDRSTT